MRYKLYNSLINTNKTHSPPLHGYYIHKSIDYQHNKQHEG